MTKLEHARDLVVTVAMDRWRTEVEQERTGRGDPDTYEQFWRARRNYRKACAALAALEKRKVNR